MVITMAKLRMAHASMHGVRKHAWRTQAAWANFYYFTMVMFESKEKCLKYNIELTVHEQESASQDSEVSFRYCGKPCSIDEDKDDLKYLGLTVNNKGMEKLMRKNEDNAFSLSFAFSDK